MTDQHPGGTGKLGTHLVGRIGYGAMGLGECPADDAITILRRAVDLGVNHFDTASFYADGEVDRRIRRALAPYRDDLLIVSKVGARPISGGPLPFTLAQKPADLRAAVEVDLTELGLECIPVVNLRRADIGPGLVAQGDQVVDLDDQLAEMIALRDEGKIGAIGVSNVGLDTLHRALTAGIVCAQNAYNLLHRAHENELDFCAEHDIAWVPFFPLGSGFPWMRSVADAAVVQRVASELDATPAQVGLAWLLAHSPRTLLIAGTTSITHLEENVRAGDIALSAEQIAALDAIPPAGSTDGDGVAGLLDEKPSPAN
jgi:aryl-alcohol dehydrogenase-like predicted oxidoreductase